MLSEIRPTFRIPVLTFYHAVFDVTSSRDNLVKHVPIARPWVTPGLLIHII